MTDQIRDRPLQPAILRGVRCRCPRCGDAPLFRNFLKPVDHCAACGQDWSLHSADDLPAYLVVLLLGHLIVPFVVEANLRYEIGMVTQMLLWPGIALVLSLVLIQPMKGAVIALQWARRMHGFSAADR